MSKNGFVEKIPDSLFKFSYKTKFVSLSHNNLSGSVPDSVVNCDNLIGFDFSYNGITGLLPRISEIPVLEFVSMRINVLSGDVFEELSKCKRVSHVHIGSNAFDGLEGRSVRSLLAAKVWSFLHVSCNELIGNVPTGCKSSKLLDLESNRLNGRWKSSV